MLGDMHTCNYKPHIRVYGGRMMYETEKSEINCRKYSGEKQALYAYTMECEITVIYSIVRFVVCGILPQSKNCGAKERAVAR
jgi:site-specific recombinase XerC